MYYGTPPISPPAGLELSPGPVAHMIWPCVELASFTLRPFGPIFPETCLYCGEISTFENKILTESNS